MGVYYNPPSELESVGRPIEGATWQEVVKQVRTDEALFGLFQWVPNGFYHAPHLYCKEEFEDFKVNDDGGLHVAAVDQSGKRTTSSVSSGTRRHLCGYFAVPMKQVAGVVYDAQEFS